MALGRTWWRGCAKAMPGTGGGVPKFEFGTGGGVSRRGITYFVRPFGTPRWRVSVRKITQGAPGMTIAKRAVEGAG